MIPIQLQTARLWFLPISLVVTCGLLGCHAHSVNQQADLAFEPPVPNPAYDAGLGPTVLIDAAHFNFHTADGRYAPFAKLLRRDGYVVESLDVPASEQSLATANIYVIANAIAESDQKDWKLPSESAFTEAEIDAIRTWVEEGRSLLLIADHMPFPGAVESLAAAFGVLFTNGFLYDAEDNSMLEFTPDSGLGSHPITDGRRPAESVSSVRTFTGQAFRVDRKHDPLLTVPSGSTIKLPVEAWEFEDTTPHIPAGGMLQGAVFVYGRGRVAVFGEAAMFTAQKVIRDDGTFYMGMNRDDATQNPQLLLNVMHWLSGLLGTTEQSNLP